MKGEWRLRAVCAAPSMTFAVWWVWMGLPYVPEPPTAVGWVVGGASVATTFLLGLKRTVGWVVMILNQVGWGWIAIGTGQDGLMVSTLVFLWLGITNLILWLREPPIRKKADDGRGKHRANSGAAICGTGLLDDAHA